MQAYISWLQYLLYTVGVISRWCFVMFNIFLLIIILLHNSATKWTYFVLSLVRLLFRFINICLQQYQLGSVFWSVFWLLLCRICNRKSFKKLSGKTRNKSFFLIIDTDCFFFQFFPFKLIIYGARKRKFKKKKNDNLQKICLMHFSYHISNLQG